MRKILFTLSAAFLFVACGGGETAETTETKPISNATVEEAAPVEAPVVAKKDGKEG